MSQLTQLPLDLTAGALSNRIQGESHTLIKIPNKPHRLVVLQHGGFYTDHLQVVDNNGITLKRGVDYTTTYLYKELTELTGREVCGAIVVINPNVTGPVVTNYRAVGGLFGVSPDELAVVLEQLEESTIEIPWHDIVGKPREYPSAEHVHKFWQLYGFENMIEVMERIVKAISHGNQVAYQHDLDYAEHYRGLAENRLDQFTAELNQHIARMDRPHSTTKAQVGLSEMLNYPMSNQVDAENGLTNDSYMSVLTTYQAVVARALPLLDEHMRDYGNPHRVTPAQINAYPAHIYMERHMTKLPRNYPAYNSEALEGRTYQDLYNAARINLSTANIVGLLPIPRLGHGGGNAQFVLRGDGQWVNIRQLFVQYIPPGNQTLYLGMIGNDSLNDDTALDHIRRTYNNGVAYPIGTVALYTTHYREAIQGSNGGTWHTMRQMSGAIRTSSGWILMN